MNDKPENRVDKIVSDLLKGRRLRLRGGDAEEKEAITTAARLAGARRRPERMSPAFRKRLAKALELKQEQGWVTRRTALVAALGLAAGAASGGLLGRELSPQVESNAGGATIHPRPGRWIDVAAFSELVDGQGKRVAAGGVGAYVFRRGDSVTAVSSICSHLPCELWWDHQKSVLACPCHPLSFFADGRPTETGYPIPALSKVQVRVTPEGRVEVLGT